MSGVGGHFLGKGNAFFYSTDNDSNVINSLADLNKDDKTIASPYDNLDSMLYDAAVKGDLDNNKAKVVSSGSGDLANEIVRIAKEYNIAVKQDKDLAEVLSTLDVYDNIPDDMYEAVAEILQELYKINKNLP